MGLEVNSNRSSFCLATLRCRRRNGISGASRSLKRRSMIDLKFRSQATPPEKIQALPFRDVDDSVLYHSLSWFVIRQVARFSLATNERFRGRNKCLSSTDVVAGHRGLTASGRNR